MSHRSPDRKRAALAIEEFLLALGHDPSKGELAGTGARVADAWIDELCAGDRQDPIALLREGGIDLGEGAHGAVVLRRLAIGTMCPHHLLPSHGYATVGFLPKRRAAGLGVVSKVVEACARRLILQETLGEQIATVLCEGLDAHGAFCKLTLAHTCFVMRGEQESEALVDTLAFAGSFQDTDRPIALVLLGTGP